MLDVMLASTADSDAAALLSLSSLAALITLTFLEIVLGIDNIIFIAILTGRVDPARQDRVRQVGLLLAMAMRIALLLGITWVMGLTETLFTLPLTETISGPVTREAMEVPFRVSGKDLVLLAGGLFLIGKGTLEIHHLVESGGGHRQPSKLAASVAAVLAQIVVMDIIFSLDSVITAVGMSRQLPVMIAAIVIAVLVMMVFANPVAHFVERHPTIKTLALAFLVLVGVLLVADGLHRHMPRGYVYFAMFFSLAVELLNMRAAARKKALRMLPS